MNRPIITLFMLESLDGKINTGNSDTLDLDKDLPKIDGVKEGLHQYYKIESNTDYFSIKSDDELNKLRALELIECNKLDDSYIQLKYKVKK